MLSFIYFVLIVKPLLARSVTMPAPDLAKPISCLQNPVSGLRDIVNMTLILTL